MSTRKENFLEIWDTYHIEIKLLIFLKKSRGNPFKNGKKSVEYLKEKDFSEKLTANLFVDYFVYKHFFETSWSRNQEGLKKDFEKIENEDFQREKRFVQFLKNCKEIELERDSLEEKDNLGKELTEDELEFQNSNLPDLFEFFTETEEF